MWGDLYIGAPQVQPYDRKAKLIKTKELRAIHGGVARVAEAWDYIGGDKIQKTPKNIARSGRRIEVQRDGVRRMHWVLVDGWEEWPKATNIRAIVNRADADWYAEPIPGGVSATLDDGAFNLKWALSFNTKPRLNNLTVKSKYKHRLRGSWYCKWIGVRESIAPLNALT